MSQLQTRWVGTAPHCHFESQSSDFDISSPLPYADHLKKEACHAASHALSIRPACAHAPVRHQSIRIQPVHYLLIHRADGLCCNLLESCMAQDGWKCQVLSSNERDVDSQYSKTS
eukprot:1159084-Pelagomonas_calceolata.AAC.18